MKNDISKLVKSKAPILNPDYDAPKSKPVGQGATPKKRTARKAESEKLVHRVQFMLSQSEYDKIVKEAGAVSMSKYIRQMVIGAGK